MFAKAYLAFKPANQSPIVRDLLNACGIQLSCPNTFELLDAGLEAVVKRIFSSFTRGLP
ncbi:MAG: hypothetical protein PHY16_17455 [Methylobacter sp.]|nr:hypothetical protein [Methylobacter sp.]